jgi:hypothetical protein
MTTRQRISRVYVPNVVFSVVGAAQRFNAKINYFASRAVAAENDRARRTEEHEFGPPTGLRESVSATD